MVAFGAKNVILPHDNINISAPKARCLKASRILHLYFTTFFDDIQQLLIHEFYIRFCTKQDISVFIYSIFSFYIDLYAYLCYNLI